MSFNTFGHLFRVTTFGESHGVAIGCVVDGCPPLIPLAADDIQRDLDRRRPGQSRFTTQRQEPDTVKILSGVMPHPESGVQVTTGAPIAPTSPMKPNTACATIAAAAVPPRARPRRALRPARLRARSYPR